MGEKIVCLKYMFLLFEKLPTYWLKSLSGLFLNLSAGWYGAAFIVPLSYITSPYWPVYLIADIANGILCLVTSVQIERILERNERI